MSWIGLLFIAESKASDSDNKDKALSGKKDKAECQQIFLQFNCLIIAIVITTEVSKKRMFHSCE